MVKITTEKARFKYHLLKNISGSDIRKLIYLAKFIEKEN